MQFEPRSALTEVELFIMSPEFPESYAYLQSLLNGERVYVRLLKNFRDADDKH